jgi:serine/threonine protein kinase
MRLTPDKVADEERRRRFMQEARAASSLNHPNIVTIHEISQADGEDFIGMELIPRRTLGHLISWGGMKLTEALRTPSRSPRARLAQSEFYELKICAKINRVN